MSGAGSFSGLPCIESTACCVMPAGAGAGAGAGRSRSLTTIRRAATEWFPAEPSRWKKVTIVTKSKCNPLFPCVFNQLGLENETLFATPRSKTGSDGTELFSSRDNSRQLGDATSRADVRSTPERKQRVPGAPELPAIGAATVATNGPGSPQALLVGWGSGSKCGRSHRLRSAGCGETTYACGVSGGRVASICRTFSARVWRR